MIQIAAPCGIEHRLADVFVFVAVDFLADGEAVQPQRYRETTQQSAPTEEREVLREDFETAALQRQFGGRRREEIHMFHFQPSVEAERAPDVIEWEGRRERVTDGEDASGTQNRMDARQEEMRRDEMFEEIVREDGVERSFEF